jgi:hypothetical protein
MGDDGPPTLLSRRARAAKTFVDGDDGPPTFPNLRTRAGNPFIDGQELTASATWPNAHGRTHRSSTNYLMPLLLGSSLVLNVVLFVALLLVLISGRISSLSEGGSPGRSASALSSPTPPATGWLQITPATVQLGCNTNQHSQFAVLDNTGSAPVQWRVTFSLPANQVGVTVNPNQGTVNPGSSMPIQIQYQADAPGPQGISGQQGSIEFNPTTPDAGPAANLAYTTVGC